MLKVGISKAVRTVRVCIYIYIYIYSSVFEGLGCCRICLRSPPNSLNGILACVEAKTLGPSLIPQVVNAYCSCAPFLLHWWVY